MLDLPFSKRRGEPVLSILGLYSSPISLVMMGTEDALMLLCQMLLSPVGFAHWLSLGISDAMGRAFASFKLMLMQVQFIGLLRSH
jgi:hypothetical protein